MARRSSSTNPPAFAWSDANRQTRIASLKFFLAASIWDHSTYARQPIGTFVASWFYSIFFISIEPDFQKSCPS